MRIGKFTVEKGDISGAFLQGDDFGPARPMVCEPLPEICEALGVPAQTPMLLTKAAYGLVEAPIQWYLSVAKFLEGLGAERQLSDPACWGFFRKDRTPIGWVCGHVDDFMFGGDHQDPEWMEIRRQIQERFKWGQWETKKFTQCGVLIEQTSDGFLLSQPEYLNSVSEIHVGRSRHQDLTAEVTNHELLQLRSVLGALSWHATQVAPQWCAPVGMLLSRISKGTIQEIVDTNKLLRRAKLSQHHKMRIHGFSSRGDFAGGVGRRCRWASTRRKLNKRSFLSDGPPPSFSRVTSWPSVPCSGSRLRSRGRARAQEQLRHEPRQIQRMSCMLFGFRLLSFKEDRCLFGIVIRGFPRFQES